MTTFSTGANGMERLLFFTILVISLNAWSTAGKGIPYPYHVVQDQSENQLMAIDSGAASLALRINLIKSAQKTIDVEYFCYNTDFASKIFTQELIKARDRGVRVRILIDKAASVFVFNKYYAQPLLEKGIEVRYYNDSSLLNFPKAIYRNHRKLLAVDGSEAITGGRNMGDEYFDLSPDFNYNDRDVFVRGPIVKAMVDSFDIYFNSSMTQKKIKVPSSRSSKKALAADVFYKLTDEEEETRDEILKLGNKELLRLKTHVCPVTTFASDAPGGGFKNFLPWAGTDDYRFLRRVINEKISEIDRSLIISTPYFLTNKDSRKFIKTLLKKNAEISIYTNSLAASDAAYMSSRMYVTLKRWNNEGVNFYFHSGEFPESYELLNQDIRNAVWSDHSKTHIYESSNDSEVMIGTFNLHNRSSFYDSEMAIFCKGNSEFTAEVKKSIERRMAEGIRIARDHSAIDKAGNVVSKFGSSESKVRLMKLLRLPVWLFKFLL